MTYLVAVDPGVHACALAWFDRSGELYSVRMATRPIPPTGDLRCVCEIPQIYDPRAAKTVKRPSDLIDVTVAAGRMTGAVRTEYVLPAQWKGQVPKAVHHKRVRATLMTDEQVVSDAYLDTIKPALRHNIWDAIGLGLVVLGRMTPGPIRGRLISQENQT